VPGTESHAPRILPPRERRPELSPDLLVGRVVSVFELHDERRGIVSAFALEPREVFD